VKFKWEEVKCQLDKCSEVEWRS